MDDAFGYATTAVSAKALSALDRARRGVLSHAADTMDHLNAAIEADPGYAAGHAVKGLLMMSLARRELISSAKDCLKTARQGIDHRGATTREKAYADALSAWIDGDTVRASSLLDGVLADCPCDTLTMKLVQAIRFMSGDQIGMRRSVEAVLAALPADHPDYGYVLGCHAFTLEETGEYERAEKVGRQGVELAPDDAWGMHAVAHVHDMTRRPDDGIDWIGRNRENFAHCNNFRYHIFWHLALFHLERKEFDEVLALYDEQINAPSSDDYRDLSNSASLLARLNLEGVHCDQRWQALAELAAHRLDDAVLGFADLHYLIAMAGAGRMADADRLGDRIAVHGAASPRQTDQTAAKVACGLKAFAHGDYASAFNGLSAAIPDLVTIGGSHAQRDVFVRLAVEAGIRGGAFSKTEDVLALRARKRCNSDSFADDRLHVIRSRSDRPDHAPTAVDKRHTVLATGG